MLTSLPWRPFAGCGVGRARVLRCAHLHWPGGELGGGAGEAGWAVAPCPKCTHAHMKNGGAGDEGPFRGHCLVHVMYGKERRVSYTRTRLDTPFSADPNCVIPGCLPGASRSLCSRGPSGWRCCCRCWCRPLRCSGRCGRPHSGRSWPTPRAATVRGYGFDPCWSRCFLGRC